MDPSNSKWTEEELIEAAIEFADAERKEVVEPEREEGVRVWIINGKMEATTNHEIVRPLHVRSKTMIMRR